MNYFIAYYIIGFALAVYEYKTRSQISKLGIHVDPAIIFLSLLILGFIQPFILIGRAVKK